MKTIRLTITISVLSLAWFLWFQGLFDSPVLDRKLVAERRFVMRYVQENGPDFRAERELAHAYWRRYPDIKADAYFGSNGPMGIFGAREHYRLHGRHEGRVFAPISEPDDMERERILALAYWHRYPDIARSVIWGKNGSLGILGPRDHYNHYGRRQGRVWGPLEEERHD